MGRRNQNLPTLERVFKESPRDSPESRSGQEGAVCGPELAPPAQGSGERATVSEAEASEFLSSLKEDVYCLKPDLPVGGRISHFLPFWKSITQDGWVLKVVEFGYLLNLERVPRFNGLRETQIRADNVVLREEVTGLRTKGAVRTVPPKLERFGFYSTYFTVPKKDGGIRPILNLKPFNRNIKRERFKMETLQSIISLMQPGVWLASVDLKDAYFHVPINRAHWKYLRFVLDGVCHEYMVTPFGLSSAPRLFTKVLIAIIAWLRLQGVQIHAYLDDLMVIGSSPGETLKALTLTIKTLTQAGYMINVKKSDLVPTQDLNYIGGRFRPDVARVFLPVDRFQALRKAVRAFAKAGALRTAQQWLQILGLMAATISLVFEARLRMRPVQFCLKESWDRVRQFGLKVEIVVPLKLIPHLLWWTVEANLQGGMPFTPPAHELTVTTDSSTKVGWGGHMTLPSGQEALFSGDWSREVRHNTHINVLELRAIRLTLQRLESQVRGRVVKCECDNTTAVAYLNRQGGTRSLDLCQEAQELWEWALRHHVLLSAVHLPGVNNTLADFLSRNRANPTEWSLNNRVTRKLFLRWGTPQVDLFASSQNHKLQAWFSRQPQPGATAVDALNQSWKGLFVYAFPPTNLIPQFLTKIMVDRVEAAILVAPYWPKRPWFTTVQELALGPAWILPLRMNLLTQCLTDRGNLFHDDLSSLKLAAWKLSSGVGRVEGSIKKLGTRP